MRRSFEKRKTTGNINTDQPRSFRTSSQKRSSGLSSRSFKYEDSIRRQLEESGEGGVNRELERGKTFFVDSPIDDSTSAGNIRKPNNREKARAGLKVARSRTSTLNIAVLQENLEQVKLLVSSGALNESDESGKTPLHRAVEKQNVEIVEYFILEGANVNSLDNREETPLHTAVRTGNVSLVEMFLLTKKANVNASGTSSKTTPLHVAAQLDQNNAAICKMLLENEADLFAKDSNGMIPIAYAAQKGFTDVMECFFQHVETTAVPGETGETHRKLLSKVDDKGSSLLHFAVASKHIEAVGLCIRKGAMVHEKRIDGTTAVHIACTHGPFELLELILRGTSFIYDYSLTDNDRNTCLHRAAQYNQAQIVDFLLSQKIDMNPVERSGKTPLMLSVGNGCNEAIQVLLDKGADVTVRDHKKKTVVHAAIGHPETLALLLKCDKIDALVEMKDKSGSTALHHAAGKGHVQEVQLLVNNRRNLSTKKDDKGDTPLHLAASNGYLDIVQILLEGDNPTMMNILDNNERTPIHLAAFGGHVEIVEYLLHRGASIQKDHDEQTPLHYAATTGSLDTVKLLLRASFTFLNALDKKQRSALHLAASAGHAHIVEYLLSIKEQDVKIINSNGQNVLDLAIEYQRVHVAMTLAEHKRWRDVFLPQSHGSLSQMELLVEKMPEVAERFLDRCIRKEGRKDSSDYKITYDLRYLQGMTREVDHNRQPQNSLKVIYAMVKHKRLRCLSHPTTVALINLKWRKYGLWLVLLNQLTSFLYLGSVIYLVITLEDNPCFNNKKQCSQSEDVNLPKRSPISGSPVYLFFLWILIGLSGLKILKQCFHVYNMGWRYFKEFAYLLEFMLGIAMIVFLSSNCRSCYSAGAIAACLAWFSLIFRISEVTFLGLYVMMMARIFETVSKVFLLLFLFLLCFGFSFFVLDFEQPLFGSLPQSLVTTFVMMMGEMNYSDLFLDNDPPMEHSEILYLLYILFCLCMPIIFLNFLIGLAVGDIESIQKEAALQKHSVQVRQLHGIENSFPKCCLKRFEVEDEYTELPNPNRAKPLKTVLFDFLVGTMATMRGKHPKEEGNEVEEVIERQNTRLKEISNLVEFHSTQLQHLRGFLQAIEESVEDAENPKVLRKTQQFKSRKTKKYGRAISS